MTLADLNIGQKAVIEGNHEEIPLKLLELGFLPGQFVEIIQIAPFKCPLYIKVSDSYLAIRRHSALELKVSVL